MMRCQGLSLSELMVWMAVIGIMASFSSIPFVGALPRVRVDRAARGIATLLEWARLRAMGEGYEYVVAFSHDDNRVDVYQDLDSDGPDEEEKVRTVDLDREYPGIVFGAASGVYRTGSCLFVNAAGLHLPYMSVSFLPSGTSDRCGSIYLIPEQDLPDRRDRMRALSILLGTGRIQLWSFDPELQSPCNGRGSWVPLR